MKYQKAKWCKCADCQRYSIRRLLRVIQLVWWQLKGVQK